VAFTTALLPAERTRYLMGVGAPDDIIGAVADGCDIFDSVLPTRVARHGAFYTRQGRRNISNAGFREQTGPLDKDCDCAACRDYSAAYLHHLFAAGELLGMRMLTLHNLRFLGRLMADCRKAIDEGRFAEFSGEFLKGYRPTDEATRLEQKEKWRKRQGE